MEQRVSIATVQLFASYADMFGASQLRVPIADATTVADLVASIRMMPNAQKLPTHPQVAVNHRFAASRDPVTANDEIALIPPVAGG